MLVISMAQLPTALVTLMSSAWWKPSSKGKHFLKVLARRGELWRVREFFKDEKSVDVAAEKCNMPGWCCRAAL